MGKWTVDENGQSKWISSEDMEAEIPVPLRPAESPFLAAQEQKERERVEAADKAAAEHEAAVAAKAAEILSQEEDERLEEEALSRLGR